MDNQLAISRLKQELMEKDLKIKTLIRLLGDNEKVDESPDQCEKSTELKCSKCYGPILDELKADPFFTGILVCQKCKKKPKLPTIQTSLCILGERSNRNNIMSPTCTLYDTPISAAPQNFPFDGRCNHVDQSDPRAHESLQQITPNNTPSKTVSPATVTTETPNQHEIQTFITKYEICSFCNLLHTSGFRKAGTTDTICKKCYQKSLEPKIRCCNKCSSWTTSKWYTDRIKPGHICKSCYTKRRRNGSFDGEERRCGGCGTNSSSIWYQDNFNFSGYVCTTCHNHRKRTS